MASPKSFETYGKDWVSIPLARDRTPSRSGFPGSM